MYLRMAAGAVLPWFSKGMTARKVTENAKGDGKFSPSDGYHMAVATVEEVEQCLNCPYPECRNCQARKPSKRRKTPTKELADSLRIHRCEEV